MPKIPKEPVEEGINPKVQKTYDTLATSASIGMAMPQVITCVNRKVNTGGYENVDVMIGISLPVAALPNDPEFLKNVEEAVATGFAIASKGTATRYKKIKNFQGEEEEEEE